MKESIIATRAFAFGLEIIKLTRTLPKTYENIIVIKQIIRSATSVGANIQEALDANSKKDFIHCMNIAKKEARETVHWLRLLMEINNDKKEAIEHLYNENQQIISMHTKIVKTSNGNL